VNLPIQRLTAAGFAPFGEVVEALSRTPDAAGPGWRWWGETAFLSGNGRPLGVGYLELQPEGLRFDWAERHMRSAEMLVPVGGDCALYVGPPDYPEEPARRPELERFQVFRLCQGQAAILHPGVWHGAPLAMERPLSAIVVLLQGTGRDDTSVVRFPDTPVTILR
jgi:ureidoglycolate lyase